MRLKMLRMLCALAALLVSASISFAQASPVSASLARAIPNTIFPDSIVIGYSMEGRPIECLALGSGPEVTLIIATIHGNEAAGTPLVIQLADCLRHRPDLLQGRKLAIVPVANPDGYVHNLRGNVRGVDLNRNFPTSNRESTERFGLKPLSEPESYALAWLLQCLKPSKIVSLHQPLDCVDYDGPADRLAEYMAWCSGLPVKKLGSRPGSLGSYAGVDMNIPIITLELPRNASKWTPEQLWMQYGSALAGAVAFPAR